MSIISVKNAGPLSGSMTVSGSKNAVLPLLAATLLCEEECIINEAPDLKDVEIMCAILRSFGAEVCFDKQEKIVRVKAANITTNEAETELVCKMRASIVTMGPILARTGRAKFPLPGGCAIGDRPIDLHLKGFVALGADVEMSEDETGTGSVSAEAKRLSGGEIYLDTPSVGATQNIMMAAVLADGVVIIENAAQEPEVVDLANFLNKMGAKIKGAGTDIIKIEGVTKLRGAVHGVIPDRIEAGTYMLAAAITRGDLTIENALAHHVKPVIAKLRETGAIVTESGDAIRVKADKGILRSTDIKTLPYPGFPTDMQPQFMAYLATVSGPSTILETVFENRFMHIAELNKMRAHIMQKEERRAIVPGGSSLVGADVTATDLRAGAALILAGLAAKGETRVADIYHIERGYEDICGKLRRVGADLTKKQ
ncbi:MAG: UDP-N-acetylglucosamine 1-carboxyvinyltransferase [Clostridiales Family XIII bacterium]|nr:UDP-N-acetylglucosamine 1-carboxyvinyltransferase [Clostridiales Family XIII bacterium]